MRTNADTCEVILEVILRGSDMLALVDGLCGAGEVLGTAHRIPSTWSDVSVSLNGTRLEVIPVDGPLTTLSVCVCEKNTFEHYAYRFRDTAAGVRTFQQGIFGCGFRGSEVVIWRRQCFIELNIPSILISLHMRSGEISRCVALTCLPRLTNFGVQNLTRIRDTAFGVRTFQQGSFGLKTELWFENRVVGGTQHGSSLNRTAAQHTRPTISSSDGAVARPQGEACWTV